MDTKNSIKEYFRGKNIFITGGSGFLGKVLIEKLLRSCPEIGKIYLLLRSKKGKVGYERIKQITSSPLFDSLKLKSPEYLEKIFPINGNTCELRLGISEKDRELLKSEIHVFFNVAASVRFDDMLKYSIFANLRSAREAAMLTLEMENIEVFLHVSTAYCNIENKKVIDEVLYHPHGDWREVIKIAETCDEKTLSLLSQKFIDGFPNTYTYTKRLAEHCISEVLVGKVATIICRPSVVVCSVNDPFLGFIDNFNGPIGLMLGGASGLVRTVYGDPDIDTDYIPVDNVVKILIVAAWHKANFGDTKSPSLYHAAKNNTMPLKQREFIDLGNRLFWDIPLEKKIWFPRGTVGPCWYNYFFNVILFHVIPAIILDLLLRVLGYPPMLFKLQKKIYIANMAVSHFMLNDWKFDNKKTIDLFNAIPQHEMAEFSFLHFPVGDEKIYEYFVKSLDYARVHMLKEQKTISHETRVRTLRMYYLDRTVQYILFGLAVWIIFFKMDLLTLFFNITYNYWNSL